MALKDLPGSVLLNVKILLDQIDRYINDLAESKAGDSSRRLAGGKEARLTIIQGAAPLAKQLLDSLYNILKANIKTQQTDKATFSTNYVNQATWKNNFFIIRTQIVGVVNPGDPVLVLIDAIWTKLESITGRWTRGK